MAFFGFLFVIFFIIVAMMWPEGLWSNLITFINALFSGLIAWNYFEPLADTLEKSLASFTYIVDYLAFWLIFAIAFNVLRIITDLISKKKARFRKPVDLGGSATFAVFTALLIVTLSCASMHFSPLGSKPFKGGFGSAPNSGTFLGFAIENLWFSQMNRLSKRAPNKEKAGTTVGTGPLSGSNHFDPKREFATKYFKRRLELEAHNNEKGSVRVQKRSRGRGRTFKESKGG